LDGSDARRGRKPSVGEALSQAIQVRGTAVKTITVVQKPFLVHLTTREAKPKDPKDQTGYREERDWRMSVMDMGYREE
jgi:hypothetical protein